MEYLLTAIDDNTDITIKNLVKKMCNNNKINYEKQDYQVLFSNEDFLVKNNNVKFTSGSEKYLCFYGKIYLDKKNKIIESIHLQNSMINLEPKNKDILIVFGGIKNSTIVEHDEKLLCFYVAPTYLLEMQDPKTWKIL